MFSQGRHKPDGSRQQHVGKTWVLYAYKHPASVFAAWGMLLAGAACSRRFELLHISSCWVRPLTLT